MDNHLHQDERRQFERLLRQQRMNRLGDRLAVLDAFLTSEEHHTVEGWQRVLHERGQDLEPAFVAQTLELLTKWGLATRREFEGAPTRYEHRHLDEHHDHLICTRCGSITEFMHPRLEDLQQKVASEVGFHCLRHKLQIYGLCKKCMASRKQAMPLPMAAPGERLRVERINGGEEVTKHLHDLGIIAGAELEIISVNGGPMVIAVCGARVALGRGAAQKVMVSHYPGRDTRRYPLDRV